MIRDLMKALHQTILLSQRVESIGGQIGSLARTSREELGALREDVMELRERMTRVEARLDTIVDLAKMSAARGRLEPPRKR